MLSTSTERKSRFRMLAVISSDADIHSSLAVKNFNPDVDVTLHRPRKAPPIPKPHWSPRFFLTMYHILLVQVYAISVFYRTVHLMNMSVLCIKQSTHPPWSLTDLLAPPPLQAMYNITQSTYPSWSFNYLLPPPLKDAYSN
ncbi:hypothetical protein BDR07DRAFT_473038 [Suillus spraguei]|nr:hypothetical protein BDR07DRAFT_473038 [Suillus spraguei]